MASGAGSSTTNTPGAECRIGRPPRDGAVGHQANLADQDGGASIVGHRLLLVRARKRIVAPHANDIQRRTPVRVAIYPGARAPARRQPARADRGGVQTPAAPARAVAVGSRHPGRPARRRACGREPPGTAAGATAPASSSDRGLARSHRRPRHRTVRLAGAGSVGTADPRHRLRRRQAPSAQRHPRHGTPGPSRQAPSSSSTSPGCPSRSCGMTAGSGWGRRGFRDVAAEDPMTTGTALPSPRSPRR